MAKQPEWIWKLPDGQRVSASFDRATRIESVWLDSRLVSRSTAEGKPDGHVVPLGPGANAGAYRGAAEARVVFDVFGKKLASCVLTIDGVEIAPTKKPRPMAAFALPALTGSVAPASPAMSVSTTPYRFSRFIDAVSRPIQECFATARKDNPKLAGRLVVEAKLGSEGRVVETSVVEHGGFSPSVEQCVATAVKAGRYELGPSSTLRFPVEYAAH